MTAPRKVVPGDVVMLTRRCTQRQFLLRPDELTNEIFAYCLAEAAKRCEMGLIAWTVMSNHYHLIVHDPKGQHPSFSGHLNKILAKVLNARWCRWENLWASEEICVTHLPTAADVFRKVVYVLANPVADHLVERAIDWPGLTSFTHLDGKVSVHERPKLYFAAESVMPAEATLEMTLPELVTRSETVETWVKRVRAAVAEAEDAARAERRSTTKRIVGRKAVLSASESTTPSTPEPRGNLRPVVARKDPRERVLELKRLVEFRVAHRIARSLYIAGDVTALFPAGTYRMRLLGARCAPFPIAA